MRKISSLLLALAILAMPLISLPSVNADSTPFAGNDDSARTQVDSASNFTIVDTNNPVASNGEITSFSYYASNANPFSFVLVDASNAVQWISPAITPTTVPGANTYTPANPIPAQQNWNVGIYFSSTGTIPYEGTGNEASYTAENSGAPTTGATLTFAGNDNRTYSFFANGNETEPVLTTINVEPADATLIVNGTEQFTATALDQFGNALTTQPTFTWTSSSTSVGTINNNGLFTAVATGGPITITASSGAVSDTAAVTVDPTPSTPPETCNKGMASGMISYTANGLERKAMLTISANPRAENFKGNGIFQYRDANKDWYMVKVSYVAISGNDVYFSGKVIASSQKDWKGQWLYAKVHSEEGNSKDTISGSFTDKDTAISHFTNSSLADPSDGPFAITKGNLNIRTFPCPPSVPSPKPNCECRCSCNSCK